jgi:hypothetical protein
LNNSVTCSLDSSAAQESKLARTENLSVESRRLRNVSQSKQVKEIVDELNALRKDYDKKQAELRAKLHDMFGDGPVDKRKIVHDLIDMFMFPES